VEYVLRRLIEWVRKWWQRGAIRERFRQIAKDWDLMADESPVTPSLAADLSRTRGPYFL